MKVGKKIRVIRELKEYSQYYMSVELEISQATYSRIENENTKIDFSMLLCIVDILNISITNLLQFDENNIDRLVNNSSGNQNKGIPEYQNQYENRIKYLEERINMMQTIFISQNKINV